MNRGNPYDPPTRSYGSIGGLPQRIADWVGRMKYDKTLPWAGLGVVDDMEAVVRLLSLKEFGEFLHTHSDPELQRWGVEVLAAHGDRKILLATIDQHLPEGDSATDAVRIAGETITDVRAALERCGALTPGDTSTPIGPLLAMLLA
jgi:hypothetical protein